MGFDDIKRDNISGAAEIVDRTARYWLHEIQKLHPTSLRRGLTYLRHRGLFIIRLQPRMAPLFNLVNNVLLTAAEAITVNELRTKSLSAIEHYLGHTAAAKGKVLRKAAELIPPHATLFTYSRSSLVMYVLRELKKQGRTFRVLLTESRPAEEGKNAARELLRAGIPTTLFVDAAMSLAVQECDLALVGADAFSEKEATNKIGTKCLALLSREMNKPIYCLATADKHLPAGIHLPREEEHDPREVWPEAPQGATIRNLYFENIPLELFTDVLTEYGLYKTEKTFAATPVDPWLQEQLSAL